MVAALLLTPFSSAPPSVLRAGTQPAELVAGGSRRRVQAAVHPRSPTSAARDRTHRRRIRTYVLIILARSHRRRAAYPPRPGRISGRALLLPGTIGGESI